VRIAAAFVAALVAASWTAAAPAGAQPAATVPAAPASPVPSGVVAPPVPRFEPGVQTPSTAQPSGDIAGNAQQPFVGITLEDAIAMALSRNTDLAVSQSSRRVAGYQVVAAQGAYDVRFQIQPLYDYMTEPPLNPFQTGPNGGAYNQIGLGASGTFNGELPGGTKYSIGLAGDGYTTNNTSTGFNPYYQTAFSLNLTQPLLRGRYDAARYQLAVAKANAGAATDATLLTASNTIASVSDAYWDLTAAWRNVAIQEEALRQAIAQSQSNGRLVKQGAAAPVDVVESNTQVSVYQDNVFSALENVSRLQNQLKQLVLNNPADPIWTANLVPTTPATAQPQPPVLGDVVLAALKHRPEIGQLREQRATSDAAVAYNRDQAKPQVDVSVGFTSNGFAGTPTSPLSNPIFAALGPLFGATDQLIAYANAHGGEIPPLNVSFPTAPQYLHGGFGTSVSTLLQDKFPVFTASATIGFPLRNRTASANYAAALEQQRTVEVQQVQLIQRIVFESRNAVQGLQASRSRLIAAAAARSSAQQVYESELRKFHAGTSTTFLVLQRETDLANQRLRELQAQTDLDKAIVELERVTGTILTENGVEANALAKTPPAPTTLPAQESPPPKPVLSPLP